MVVVLNAARFIEYGSPAQRGLQLLCRCVGLGLRCLGAFARVVAGSRRYGVRSDRLLMQVRCWCFPGVFSTSDFLSAPKGVR